MDRFSTGNAYPYFVRKVDYVDISTEDFSPTVDPSLSASEIGMYTQRGFLVRALADGNLYAIPHQDYVDNNNSLTGLVPKKFPMSANQWAEFVCIKVYDNADSTYPSTIGDGTSGAGNINIGIL